jgi:hypothetical protein
MGAGSLTLLRSTAGLATPIVVATDGEFEVGNEVTVAAIVDRFLRSMSVMSARARTVTVRAERAHVFSLPGLYQPDHRPARQQRCAHPRWKKLDARGVKVLARVKSGLNLRPIRTLADGSYIAKIYKNDYDRKKDRDGIEVRGVVGHEAKNSIPGASCSLRIEPDSSSRGPCPRESSCARMVG